jgi:molybdenum cofactor biosynthesis protein B
MSMSPTDDAALRCLVATVALGRASVRDDIAQIVIDELHAAGIVVTRSLTVHREKEFITQLVSSATSSNEADVVILIGGVGIGPRDFTCEALIEMADRRMEGFGEAYRRLLLEDGSADALLVRAEAGVCNQCVVLALPRQPAATTRAAMTRIVVPILPNAVRIAAGIGRRLAP